jgi:hypothetical protein
MHVPLLIGGGEFGIKYLFMPSVSFEETQWLVDWGDKYICPWHPLSLENNIIAHHHHHHHHYYYYWGLNTSFNIETTIPNITQRLHGTCNEMKSELKCYGVL